MPAIAIQRSTAGHKVKTVMKTDVKLHEHDTREGWRTPSVKLQNLTEQEEKKKKQQSKGIDLHNSSTETEKKKQPWKLTDPYGRLQIRLCGNWHTEEPRLARMGSPHCHLNPGAHTSSHSTPWSSHFYRLHTGMAFMGTCLPHVRWLLKVLCMHLNGWCSCS